MAYSTTDYYSMRNLLSYDRNKFMFRGIIGARGIGKSYQAQGLTCNFYHKVKLMEDRPAVDDLFIWLRLTDAAATNMTDSFLKRELELKHNIVADVIGRKDYFDVYYNDTHIGHIMSLQKSPNYKGVNWDWKRYRYVILDEFQRERKERRTFDINYNLRSLLESVTRITTRMKQNMDLPTVIFMGNTVDEATDLLYSFDFMPLEYGIYKLPAKSAIIEYYEDGKAYQKMQKINPLRVLSQGDDFTFGERRLKIRDNIIDWNNTGARKYIGHLQVTSYIKFEMHMLQNGKIYISSGIKTKKFENKTYTLHRLAANKGTYYSVKIHQLIRQNYNNNNIAFDKNITAKIFHQNLK